MENKRYPLLETILEEQAQAPVFHFSPINRFVKIVKSNKLIPRKENEGTTSFTSTDPFIAFTRDIGRTFIPRTSGEGLGFRFNRETLRQKFGKRLRPFAKAPLELKDLRPKDQERVKLAQKTGDFSKIRGVGIGGKTGGVTELSAIARGDSTRISKFESEERLWGKEGIPNLKQVVSGIVIPGKFGLKLVKRGDVTAVAISLIWLSGSFSRDRGSRARAFDIRNDILDAVKKLNVPIVFGRKEFSMGQVLGELKKLFALKKARDPKLEVLLDKYIGKNRSSLTFNLSGLRELQSDKILKKLNDK